jgi:hypothetical protein
MEQLASSFSGVASMLLTAGVISLIVGAILRALHAREIGRALMKLGIGLLLALAAGYVVMICVGQLGVVLSKSITSMG